MVNLYRKILFSEIFCGPESPYSVLKNFHLQYRIRGSGLAWLMHGANYLIVVRTQGYWLASNKFMKQNQCKLVWITKAFHVPESLQELLIQKHLE